MYIELEPEQRVIPKITFKRSRNSNIIKKSDVRCFQEAQALVMAMQEHADECQSILEQQVIQMIEDKEKALNEYVEESYNNVIENWVEWQNDWFDNAESKLAELLSAQQKQLNELKEELKESVITAVKARLVKLNQSEHLISHLIEVLHAEVEDEAKNLSVEKTIEEDGVTLTIENEDSIVSINTASLIAELRSSLDQL
ncbi:hypothetical protein GCM10007938_12470 [Vibrio zhanjiangensis]|uniref:Uncharacterized protein n=1 Tax=Vibrio zhanjiangensis TaxID=1046128 RepID=A0ABQ6EWA9_9VIBR|nr:hypothetical protein [Vibrio zhanjiangensis]GLT17470.1 hypothetical protein GCM10007938_12470 [Vibrio zhanjiangensis]